MNKETRESFKRASAYAAVVALAMAGGVSVDSSRRALGQEAQEAQRLVASSTATRSRAADATAHAAVRLAANYGRLPMGFEPNHGQTAPAVKFLSHGQGYGLFLTGDEAVLTLENARQKAKVDSRSAKVETRNSKFENGNADSILRMKLVGANASATVHGAEELPGRSNYFIGSDPKQWRTNVPNYAQVKYRNVYPGVDLVYHGNQGGHLEYDFIVAPGADPSVIVLDVTAVGTAPLQKRASRPIGTPPKIASDGDLVLGADDGEVRFHKPVIYQDQSIVLGPESGVRNSTSKSPLETRISAHRQSAIGNRQLVEGRYVVTASNQVRFALGQYDHSKPLVIDPVLIYTSYLGGSSANLGNGIAVDSSGNAYVVGSTFSTDFPTLNPVQPMHGNDNGLRDAFVTKVAVAGDSLDYSTYLGGSGDDEGYGIAVDSLGDAYVVGTTASSDFPTTGGAYQTSKPGVTNAFVTKLTPSGNALAYSTYVGGNSSDYGRGIAVDSSDNTYLTGYTSSSNFPTVNAFQSSLTGTTNAFVTKLNATGSALVYSTYLGGTYLDYGQGIAIDSSLNTYVTGYTSYSNFPTTPNAFQPSEPGSTNAFVTKLNPTGNALVYSTYLGSSEFDYGYGIAVNSAGTAFVTGATNSYYFPTAGNPFQLNFDGGLSDAFVTELNAAGSGLVYSTYLGGSGQDEGYSIALDSSGDAFVTGVTFSTDFPTANAFQATHGNDYGESDAFVAMLNGAGSGLTYSSFLGGNNYDYGYGIAVDLNGNAYVTGQTSSSDFPDTNTGFQNTNTSETQEAFVGKIQAVPLSPGIGLSPNPLPFGNQPQGITSAIQSVILSSSGTGPLNLTSIAVSANYSLATTSTSCPYAGGTVVSGGTCTIDITFTPGATGPLNGTVTVTDNAGGSPQGVSLTGTGTPAVPVAGVSAPSLSFGNQAVGTTSASQPITLSNTGSVPLTITTIAAGANFGETNTCVGSVAAGGMCSISVTFTPTASGVLNGTLTITDNNNGTAGSTQTVSLSGTGTAPIAGVAPATLPFGNQAQGTTSASQPITLSNTGTAALTIASIVPSANFGETDNCAGSVAAGGSCTINVTFKPTANGVLNGTLTITDNNNGVAGSTQTVSLSGTGTGTPVASLSPSTTLSLGNTVVTSTSASQPATLSNTGTAPLTITSIAVSASYAQTNNCDGSLAAGSSCTINVTFTPSAPGPLSGVLTVTDNNNGVAASTQTLNLSGTGVDFSVTSPTGVQTIAQGGQAAYTINVGSVGGAFANAVILACSNLPATTTCAFATSPVTPGANGASTQLTLSTTAPTTTRALPPLTGHPPAPSPAFLLGVFMAALAGVWRTRRRSPRWAAASGLIFGALLATSFMAGCGGGGGGGFPLVKVGGTPAGTYTITVTGTSGSAQHSTTITLAVTAS